MEATYHRSKYLKVLSQALLIPSLFPPSATQPSRGIALEIQRLVSVTLSPKWWHRSGGGGARWKLVLGPGA